jgi:Domain of unknown function (DUF1992)
VSWIERVIEERLAQAAASGELDTPHLKGKPLPDLDRPREQGWWADQFVRREMSHDRRRVAEAASAEARAGFWRAGSVDELRELVSAANVAIAKANLNLIASDHLPLFDWPDVRDRWTTLRR